jgi:uncharacterized OB-fold protein
MLDITTIYICSVAVILAVYGIAVFTLTRKRQNKEQQNKSIMVKCSVCGNKIESEAEVCPYCHTVRKHNGVK